MNEEYIDAEDPCFVDVAYRCPGRPLNAEMENMLSFAAGDNGHAVGGRFADGCRIAQYWFRRRVHADAFCKYVRENYPEAETSLVVDFAEE